MPATLRDVAARANVAVRTVSNVVSGYAHVSEQMRYRVLAAIEELDYRPNPAARTLRTGRTGVLALVLPEVDVPYFSALARDVINAAAARDYRVMIDQTGHDHERERELLSGSDRAMLFDGVLFSPLVTPEEAIDIDTSTRTPLILLGEHRFDGRFDHVAIDNIQAAADAVSHLIARGRRRIAAIGAQPLEPYATPQQRTAGYRRALDAAGLPERAEYARSAAHYSRADGYSAAVELLRLDPRPDAIFCFSDILAIGAMRAIFDAGLRVPDDIAVVGIDDIEEGHYWRPSLSSVSLDTGYIARRAVSRVIDRIDNPELAPEQFIAPHALHERESTAT